RFGAVVPEPGIPRSHWIPYLSVEDVDASCARARELGGAVFAPPHETAGLGRSAVVTDPQGAPFSPLCRSAGAPTPDTSRPLAPGSFCWDELTTPQPAIAAAFYGELFGWRIEQEKLPGGPYWLVREPSGQEFAGLGQAPAGVAQRPPLWLSYVLVASVD